jgi:hypothetical protein
VAYGKRPTSRYRAILQAHQHSGQSRFNITQKPLKVPGTIGGGRIVVRREIDQRWKDATAIKDKKLREQTLELFSKYHYFYKNDNGEVSLLYLPPKRVGEPKGKWETYVLDAKSFVAPETMRFDTKKEAEVKIVELLA